MRATRHAFIILKSHIHTTKSVSTLPKLKISVKSVQTTRVVCTNYG